MNAAANIAAIAAEQGVALQALLAEVVAAWRAAGANVVGVTAETHGLPDRTCGAGYLRDIASGKPYSIYLDVAPSHTSCHLDNAGVAHAGALIVDQIAAADVVVLNKFGKLEAMGEGLLPAFAAAIAAGKPLLTTVSDNHRKAWQSFAPGAVVLAAKKATLSDWWNATARRDHPGRNAVRPLAVSETSSTGAS